MSDPEEEPIDPIAAAREARKASLLDRYGKAGKFNAAERRELAQWVPEVEAEIKAAEKAARAEIREATRAAPGEEDWPFALPCEAYIDRIPGVASTRTLRRWIAKGREANDLPPLDEPWNLSDWWARNMKQAVPKAILELASEAPDEITPSRSGEQAGEDEPRGELGFKAELSRLRLEAEAAARALRLTEEGEPSPSRVKLAADRYDSALSRLREWERDAPKILREQGDLVDRRLAERKILEREVAVCQRLRGSAGKLFQKLTAEFPEAAAAITLEQFSSIFSLNLDDCFRSLAEVGFTLSEDDEAEGRKGFGSGEPGSTNS